MRIVRRGVTMNGATLTLVLAMLRRHSLRTLQVNLTPIRTPRAVVRMNSQQVLLGEQQVLIVQLARMDAGALIRDLAMTTGTGLTAQTILAQAGLMT